jgi:glycosyltransferase involved in cell wall biosynthesis
MISNKFQIEPGNLCILMAGVNLSNFISKANDERLSGLNLVYHGRIDRNRGIMNLPLILEKLLRHDIDAKMHFIGDGDVYHLLENISKTEPNLILHGKIKHEELPQEICNYQIGLLPMPPISAWTIASPLKRSEYLASGLAVLGVDHPGHHLPCGKSNTEWYALVDQESFVSDAVAQIIKWNEKGHFTDMGLKSRTYAEKNLDWNITVNSLTSWIHQQLE